MLKVKRLLTVLLILSIILSCTPVMAAPAFTNEKIIACHANKQVIFKDTIEVTSKGGTFEVGFVTIKFPNKFLGNFKGSKTFKVEIYAENGVPYIEFSPDVPKFSKEVHIKVDSYCGLLYDKGLKTNIQVKIKKHNFKVDHFSRYAFSL